MREKRVEGIRKHAGLIVGAAAVLLLMLTVITRISGAPQKNAVDAEARAAYLAALGWEIEPGSEEVDRVRIPDCREGAMAQYNALMRKGGFDLSSFAGKEVERYSYVLTNYPGCSGRVLVTLYVSRGRVIGGDIHTAALDGFMHELRARE